MTWISPRYSFVLIAAISFLFSFTGIWLYGQTKADVRFSLAYDPSCDLHKGDCTSLLPDGGKVIFGISPQTLPVMEPLTLNVVLRGVEPRKVEVDFAGVDMNMGLNHTILTPIGGSGFSGSITIPVCIRDSMEWEANVLLYTADGIIAVPYRFWTGK